MTSLLGNLKHKQKNVPTAEELAAGTWMRFEYHQVTREAFVFAETPHGHKLTFQVRKNGKPETGLRTFKPHKMVAIETCEPDWDNLPEDWQPLLEHVR